MSRAYIRKWLGISRGFSDVNLYSRSSPASLQLDSVEEEYKTCQVRTALLLQSSKDRTVHNTITRSKKNWSPEKAIQEAESRLRISEIVGIVAQGRSGLGSFKTTKWNEADNSARRQLIIGEVRKKEEEQRQVKAVSLATQGAWTRWEAVEPRKISSSQILTAEESMLTFFLRATTDTLPSLTQVVCMETDRRSKVPTVPRRSCIIETCPELMQEGSNRTQIHLAPQPSTEGNLQTSGVHSSRKFKEGTSEDKNFHPVS